MTDGHDLQIRVIGVVGVDYSTRANWRWAARRTDRQSLGWPAASDLRFEGFADPRVECCRRGQRGSRGCLMWADYCATRNETTFFEVWFCFFSLIPKESHPISRAAPPHNT